MNNRSFLLRLASHHASLARKFQRLAGKTYNKNPRIEQYAKEIQRAQDNTEFFEDYEPPAYLDSDRKYNKRYLNNKWMYAPHGYNYDRYYAPDDEWVYAKPDLTESDPEKILEKEYGGIEYNYDYDFDDVGHHVVFKMKELENTSRQQLLELAEDAWDTVISDSMTKQCHDYDELDTIKAAYNLLVNRGDNIGANDLIQYLETTLEENSEEVYCDVFLSMFISKIGYISEY